MNASQALKKEQDLKVQAEKKRLKDEEMHRRWMEEYEKDCLADMPKTRKELDGKIDEAIKRGKKAITWEAGGVPVKVRNLLIKGFVEDDFEVNEYERHFVCDMSDDVRNVDVYHYNVRISWARQSPEFKKALADKYLHNNVFMSWEGGFHLECSHCRTKLDPEMDENQLRQEQPESKIAKTYRERFIQVLIEDGCELDCRYSRY
jgi:hypothetical protein